MTKKLLSIVICTILVNGCAVQRMNEVRKDAEDTGVKASSLIKQMGDNAPVVQFTSGQYINTTPLPKPKYDAPREVVNCQVTYKTAKPQDIFQFAQDMSEQCHIRVRVTPDAAAYLSGGGESGSKTQRLATVPSPVMNSGEMKPLAMFGAEANGNTSPSPAAASRYITDVSYSGNFGGVMDLVTARMGVSWKYSNDEPIIYYLETKRFDIQPADAKYDLTGMVTSGLSKEGANKFLI